MFTLKRKCFFFHLSTEIKFIVACNMNKGKELKSAKLLMFVQANELTGF
jgi:hypothetical protein